MRGIKLTLLLFVMAFTPWIAIAANNPLGQNVQGCIDNGGIADNERPVVIAGRDTATGAIVSLPVTAGALVVSGGGGGGGAVTVADGADVTQGSIADAGTTGPGTVNAHLRSIALALVSPVSVAVSNFPATQPVSGTVAVSNFPATQPVSGTVAVSNFPATQPVSGTVTANQGTNGTNGVGSWFSQGPTAAGGAIVANPVVVAGELAGNAKLLHLTTLGSPVADQGLQGTGGTASWQVQGAVAAGVAVSGNPVLVAGKDLSGNTQTAVTVNATTSTLTNAQAVGMLASGIMLQDTGNGSWNNLRSSTNITDGNGGTQTLPMVMYAANNFANTPSIDRWRNNVDVTLLASAARTTTQTSADITTYNLGAITVTLDMTVVGTGSVTLSIDGKDPASGKYYNLLTGGLVITNSTNVYFVDPTIAGAANVNAQRRLPRIIRIVVTANNANAATYSVGYTLQVT